MDIMTVRPDDILCISIPLYNFGKPVQNMKYYALGAEEYKGCECPVQKMYVWSSKQEQMNKNIDFDIEDITKGIE